MSGVLLLGALWAVAGILLGIRWWAERAQDQEHRAPIEVAASARFGQPAASGAERRLQAMRLAYASGALAVAVGLWGHLAVVLGLGAAMVNLGTMYRYLVVLLDTDHLDQPLIDRPQRVVAQHRRSRPPLVRRVLVGGLSD